MMHRDVRNHPPRNGFDECRRCALIRDQVRLTDVARSPCSLIWQAMFPSVIEYPRQWGGLCLYGKWSQCTHNGGSHGPTS